MKRPAVVLVHADLHLRDFRSEPRAPARACRRSAGRAGPRRRRRSRDPSPAPCRRARRARTSSRQQQPVAHDRFQLVDRHALAARECPSGRAAAGRRSAPAGVPTATRVPARHPLAAASGPQGCLGFSDADRRLCGGSIARCQTGRQARASVSACQAHLADYAGLLGMLRPPATRRPGLCFNPSAHAAFVLGACQGFLNVRRTQTADRHSRGSPPDGPASLPLRRREVHRGGGPGGGCDAGADSRRSEPLVAIDELLDACRRHPPDRQSVERRAASYAGPASDSGTLHDPHRDATTLPLIPRAVAARRAGARRLPRLPGDERRVRRHALAEACTRSPGSRDHREDKEQPLEVQYGPAHEVVLDAGRRAAPARRARTASA